MSFAAPSKGGAGSKMSNTSGSSKPSKRGTSSFSSRVPRFPEDKMNGPSPGQYDPVQTEKVKGVIPLAKQTPKTRNLSYPAGTSKYTRTKSTPRSMNSSSMNSSSFNSNTDHSSSASNTPTTTRIPFFQRNKTNCTNHSSSRPNSASPQRFNNHSPRRPNSASLSQSFNTHSSSRSNSPAQSRSFDVSPNRSSKRNSTNANIRVPFAPPKRSGIVNTTPSAATLQRQKSGVHRSASPWTNPRVQSSHERSSLSQTRPHSPNVPVLRKKSPLQKEPHKQKKDLIDEQKPVNPAPIHPAESSPLVSRSSSKYDWRSRSSSPTSLDEEGSDRTALWHDGRFSVGDTSPPGSPAPDLTDYDLPASDEPTNPSPMSDFMRQFLDNVDPQNAKSPKSDFMRQYSDNNADPKNGQTPKSDFMRQYLDNNVDSKNAQTPKSDFMRQFLDNNVDPKNAQTPKSDFMRQYLDNNVDPKNALSPKSDFMRQYLDNNVDLKNAQSPRWNVPSKLAPKDLHATGSYSSNMFQVFTAGVAANKMNTTIGDNLLIERRGSKECTALSSKNERKVNVPSRASSPYKQTKDGIVSPSPSPRRTMSPTKEAAKPRTTRTSRDSNTMKKVNETVSFPKADPKKNSPAGGYHKCLTSASNVQPKSALKEKESPWLKLKRRSRTQEVGRDHPQVSFKPRSQSVPAEVESVLADAVHIDWQEEWLKRLNQEVIDEKEVELSSTIYDEEPPHTLVDSEDGVDNSDVGSVGIDIDLVCCDNNLTIYADIDRSQIKLESRSSDNLNKQMTGQSQSMVKLSAPEHRPGDNIPRSKSIPRLGLKPQKSTTRSRSAGEAQKSPVVDSSKSNPNMSEEDRFAQDLKLMNALRVCESEDMDKRSEKESRVASPNKRPECHSDNSSQYSATTANTFTVVKSDLQVAKLPKLAKSELQRQQTEEVTNSSLSFDVLTTKNKPACQYVREASGLLERIPLTAQHISESFQKMLNGLRAYITLPPLLSMKRADHLDQILAFVNETDGNAFYISQEVKSELKKCVTMIANNLHMLLALNDAMEDDRRRAQMKIDDMLVQREQVNHVMEEYRRLLEAEQKKSDDWAYRCRKEKEKKRFVEGSKDLVEKEAARQSKELTQAKEQVIALRKEIKEFEKKLDEMRTMSLQKEVKLGAKLKHDQQEAQEYAEQLAQYQDEIRAVQRTCQQMSDSHIRENNTNMVRIQELEKLVLRVEERIQSVQDEKTEVEKQLTKKDDYLKLVEGATLNLVRQTNPGREMPSMPEDFGLNPREVTVWEQLTLCRGHLSDLEKENCQLKEENDAMREKVNNVDGVYQWAQANETLVTGPKNEFTILEQPNAELVAEMEEMRRDNKALKDKLTAKEKHCNLAHGKIIKLQDLLNSLRISESEDADRVEVATLRQQIAELKTSMREMMARTKEMDLKCATQEIQLKQRDFHNENQQRLLETRNKVIEVLMAKGRDVSTMDNFMGFGDMFRSAVSGEDGEARITQSMVQLTSAERQRLEELEAMMTALQRELEASNEQRDLMEDQIAELEVKLLKADRTKSNRSSNKCSQS